MIASSVNIGQEIYDELQRQGKSVVWFAEELGIQRPNAYRIFKSRSVDSELLYNISVLLNKDFHNIYSNILNNNTLPPTYQL